MDIIDILDKKVKDTVEAKVRLEEKLVNLNKTLEKLSDDNKKLRVENDIYIVVFHTKKIYDFPLSF